MYDVFWVFVCVCVRVCVCVCGWVCVCVCVCVCRCVPVHECLCLQKTYSRRTDFELSLECCLLHWLEAFGSKVKYQGLHIPLKSPKIDIKIVSNL